MDREMRKVGSVSMEDGSVAGSGRRGLAKVREGRVVSNKMHKTIVVSASRLVKHAVYGKYVRKHKKYYAHDENNECQIGDIVQIVECRPLSKLKRWRVRRIVRRVEFV